MPFASLKTLEAAWRRAPAPLALPSAVGRGVWRSVVTSTMLTRPEVDSPENSELVGEKASAKKTSKAMLSYMERSTKHQEFMRKQISEFEIGKRHLANMMGEDPENFTQEDIDRAIEYLFPTGMFDKKARPKMRHPSEVFPQQKEAQFDETGRPHHSLFYTLKPNFYMTLHELVEKINHLHRLESKNVSLGLQPDPTQKLSLLGSEWVNVEGLSKMMVETLNEYQYQEFVRAMNRLVEHPLSYHHKDFIFKFRELLKVTTEVDAVPELMFDVAGRPYMRAAGFRKKSIAQVTVRGRGSGQVTVNDRPLLHYFWRSAARSGNQDVAQVMYPLQVTGLLDAVDVEATVEYHGPEQRDEHHQRLQVEAPSSQAGALRHGVSLALRSFVDTEMRETMRLAGLLTRDVRTRERYKPGKKKARKGRTWKKR